jgi:hypothetical protein
VIFSSQDSQELLRKQENQIQNGAALFAQFEASSRSIYVSSKVYRFNCATHQRARPMVHRAFAPNDSGLFRLECDANRKGPNLRNNHLDPDTLKQASQLLDPIK